MSNSFRMEITRWHGLEAHVLRSADYEAIILPDFGANCIALRYLPTGTPLLREPALPADLAQSPYIYGLPLLFPPNRIRDGAFVFEGRRYDFPINDAARNSHLHGLLAQTRFSPCGDGTFCYEATDSAPYLSFPHSFRIERRYALGQDGLAHEIRVTNTSDRTMPLAVGLHAAFRVSAPEDTLMLPVKEEIVLNPDTFLPTGAVHTDGELIRALRQGTLLAQGCALSRHFSLHPGAWRLRLSGLDCRFLPDPSFRFAMLWNQDGRQGFICPEPQSCMVNAFKLDAPVQVTGADALAAGQTRVFHIHIGIDAP